MQNQVQNQSPNDSGSKIQKKSSGSKQNQVSSSTDNKESITQQYSGQPTPMQKIDDQSGKKVDKKFKVKDNQKEPTLGFNSSPKVQVPGGSASGSGQKQKKIKELKYNQNGAQQKNYYNPPSKVMRHMAQQSYYENFYNNQSYHYTMKLKFKTQMCKHYMEEGECPLHHYCQFAHGPEELRQPNDPLPSSFGKTALGAVHSNYKTEQCKYWQETGSCKYGASCSFFHGNSEKRKLIDPLPMLPEGAQLPPSPEQIKNKNSKSGNGFKNQNFQQIPIQQQTMIPVTNLADIIALGGFNPNKYMLPAHQTPGPQQFNQANFGGFQPQFLPPHIVGQQMGTNQPYQPNLGPQQFNPQKLKNQKQNQTQKVEKVNKEFQAMDIEKQISEEIQVEKSETDKQ